jgi:hypothetical protein
LSGRWSKLASSPKARVATIALLILQLAGCALDLTTEQASLGSAFCLAAPGHGALESLGFALWIVLSFSWLVGLGALRVARLRPLYWALLAAIPLAWLGQAWMIGRHLLFCDAP